MWQDPIVKETRELRRQYAAKFKNDADAIFEDILKRQEASKKNVLHFRDVSRNQIKKWPNQLTCISNHVSCISLPSTKFVL